MKLPRDLTGRELAQALARKGYAIDRQTGSHIRLTAVTPRGEHHITILDHDPLRIGTLNAVLRDVADHSNQSRDELLSELFG